MRTLLVLIVVVALGAAAYWFFTDAQQKQQMQRAEQEAARRAGQLKDSVKEHLQDFHLSTPEIKQELERTGKVIRKKTEQAGAALADATADARITAAIKAKLLRAPGLSAVEISVATTDGVVTLSGRVDSPEAVKESMTLALETDGVREVISTLQVKAGTGH
jgi:hyperosmotically inducible protein